MKKFLLSILILFSISILTFESTFVNANDKVFNSSDTIDAITKVTFKSKSDISNNIWYEKNGYKGYLYKRKVVFKYGIYLVTYSGTLRRGSYVPNMIYDENF